MFVGQFEKEWKKMEIPLALKQTKTGLIEYRIHPLFRFFYACIAIILFVSSVFFGALNMTGILISLAALAGALYTEHWRFDSKEKEVIYFSGILPFLRKQEWPFAEVDSISISPYLKGVLDQSGIDALATSSESRISKGGIFHLPPENRIKIRLVIDFTDGRSLSIDETEFRSKARMIRNADKISGLTGIVFRK